MTAALDLPARLSALRQNRRLVILLAAGAGLVLVGGVLVVARRSRPVRPEDLATALRYLQEAGVGITVAPPPPRENPFGRLLMRGLAAGAGAAAPIIAQKVSELIQERAALMAAAREMEEAGGTRP